MSVFYKELNRRQPPESGRRWLFVPYDQLTDRIGPLSREAPSSLGIVLIEAPWKAGRRPYHRQKLALILANLRHFALEQAERGVAVRHVISPGSYGVALAHLIPRLGPIRVMAPAERELREDLEPLIREGKLKVLPHEGWLTSPELFRENPRRGPPWRMDVFYRAARRASGILMEGGKPFGGKFSFDAENRLSWRGKPPAPDPPRFPRDPVKEEVGRLIMDRFSRHPGRLNLDSLPATPADARALWSWAKDHCLPYFGPYEDAMSVRSAGLFHTRISSLLNIHRLLPREVVSDALEMKIPLPSREGFLRQILGWREYVGHVHRETDGFRRMPALDSPIASAPGDGGFRRWSGRRWDTLEDDQGPDGGACPNALSCRAPLPPAYWGVPSGMACLDRVVADVWSEGYSHHITRLMIVGNIASLLDSSPRELTDWFWSAYTDAYDWVVEPNVLGMGTYALGDLMTTKPYVSGTPYIQRMSDYCSACAFSPGRTCLLSSLYWDYLGRHQKELKGNHRMAVPLRALEKRDASIRRRDRRVYETVSQRLAAGVPLSP